MAALCAVQYGVMWKMKFGKEKRGLLFSFFWGQTPHIRSSKLFILICVIDFSSLRCIIIALYAAPEHCWVKAYQMLLKLHQYLTLKRQTNWRKMYIVYFHKDWISSWFLVKIVLWLPSRWKCLHLELLPLSLNFNEFFIWSLFFLYSK